MPFYSYRCKRNHTQDELRSIEQRNDPLKCSTCGGKMTLELSPTPGVVKNPAVHKRAGRVRR